MYPDLYKGLKVTPEDLLPYSSPLMSFDGKLVIPKGMIRLPIQTDPEIVEVNFIVVDTYSPYIAIVGRPWLHTLRAVASSLHQKVKFPSGDQILEIRGYQPIARQCMVAAISHRLDAESSTPVEKDLFQSKAPAPPLEAIAEEAKCEDLEKVVVGNDAEKFFQIGAKLPPQKKEELVEFLKRNTDMFAWDAYNTSGIDPAFICHHLNVNPSITPIKQSPQHPSREHAEAIKEKVMKLRRVGAIKEVFYPEWLANIVVVKKKNGKWRVCIDFTDLNKACPKDPFPMPGIDQLVDATAGHPRMSFLDAF